MNTTVEIDKAGRIVIPKKLRDALHLTPGTRLRIERSGDRMVMAPSTTEARLVISNGLPLIFPADDAETPVLTNEMVTQIIEQGRLEREQRYLGLDENDADQLARKTA